MDTISIIIPAYNCSDYLHECLESLVTQTYKNWEGILVDDGSNDGKTPSLCDEWGKKESRLKVIHLSRNRGLSVARNVGVMNSSAPLITFLDSDDFLEPTHLETLYNALTQSNASIAMCGIRRCYHSGKLQKLLSMFPQGTLLTQPSLFTLATIDLEITSHVWNKLYRREHWKGIEFPEGRNYEDYFIALDIMGKVETLVHTGVATYNYRYTPKGITQTLSLRNRYSFALGAVTRIQQIKSYPRLSDEEKISLLAFPLRRLLGQYRQILKYPPSEEKQEVVKTLQKELLALNIATHKKTLLLQIACYILQMRQVQRKYRKRLKRDK